MSKRRKMVFLIDEGLPIPKERRLNIRRRPKGSLDAELQWTAKRNRWFIVTMDRGFPLLDGVPVLLIPEGGIGSEELGQRLMAFQQVSRPIFETASSVMKGLVFVLREDGLLIYGPGGERLIPWNAEPSPILVKK